MDGRKARSRKSRQRTLEFRSWGGARKGAGRKPRGDKAGVSHAKREALPPRVPVHVTIRVSKGICNLRSPRCMRRVRLALLKGKDRFGFRLTQFSVQSNHVHLIVEAENKAALTRGMKGLCVRLARAINRVMGRRGTVFSDRYHAHILRTPTEVRNAIRYVRDNSKIHAKRAGRKWNHSVDPFAGGPCERTFFEENRRLVVAPRFWLLRKAWAPP